MLINMQNLLEIKIPQTQFYTYQLQEKFKVTFLKLDSGPETLEDHAASYLNLFKQEFHKIRKSCARKIVDVKYAQTVSEEYSAWMIAWLCLSWNLVFEECDLLRKVLIKESSEKIKFLNNSLPEKQAKYNEIVRLLKKLEKNPETLGSSERSYYEKNKFELEKEIKDTKQAFFESDQILRTIDKYRINQKKIYQQFVFFVRGSISRQELTFLSDIDFGYCVNNSSESFLDYKIVQELIKRFEELMVSLPIKSAGIYFELFGDNLHRFNASDSIYTIPSILESKPLLGNAAIMSQLKDQFQETCLKPKLIGYLNSQYRNLDRQIYELVDIKSGIGGIRQLQTSLWSIMVSNRLNNGTPQFILDYLHKQNLITFQEVEYVLIANQFFLELRNFKQLKCYSSDEIIEDDLIDQRTITRYLKLSNRFKNIDQFDQQMIFCIQIIKTLSELVQKQIKSKSYTETLQRLKLKKSYFDNQIIEYQWVDQELELSWLSKPERQQKKYIKQLFSQPCDLIELLLNISQTGSKFDNSVKSKFAGSFNQLEDLVRKIDNKDMIRFLKELFLAPYTYTAIDQMWGIMNIDMVTGQIKTLLGLFIPEADKMRYVRRNTEIHEFPLCVHSNMSLKMVEKELENLKQNDPELLKFLNEESIFALKWSCLFHDIGKIDLDSDHEKSGPKIAVKIFQRFDWNPTQRTIGLIRLLIEHHQSVVKYSRLSTYPEIGINKYLDLAERDPRKVLLLFLINISDYKSVNQAFRQKTAAIIRIFEKTMEIFQQLKINDTDNTVTTLVNTFLNKKIIKTKNQVGITSLLQKCIAQNVKKVFLEPINIFSNLESKAIKKKYGSTR